MLPMLRVALILAIVAVSGTNGFAQRLVLPNTVKKCLKDKRGVKVLTDKNPFLLKGYLDGDAILDYALHVRSKNGDVSRTRKGNHFQENRRGPFLKIICGEAVKKL
jgi:hypothetical protein